MRPLKNKDYYLAQEVVDKFGISKKTLFDWEKQGIIPKIPKDWGDGVYIAKGILNR